MSPTAFEPEITASERTQTHYFSLECDTKTIECLITGYYGLNIEL
jgi:hypothetical protein